MTAARDFVAAMVRRPLDRVLPLVYADFLEEAGEVERAEWVRLGQEMMREVEAGGNEGRVVGRRRKLWRRVRPAYWGVEYGPDRRDPAAFVRLHFNGSPWAVRKLAAAPWPRQALAEGWLGGVEYRDYGDGLSPVLDAYEGSLAGVPLALTLPPAARTPEFVADLFDRLARLGTLTRLTLNFRDSTPAAPAGRSWLQRVFAAPPPSPGDADLLRLAPLGNLCALTLTNCPGVTGAGVAALRAAIPGLEVRLNGVGAGAGG